MFKFPKLIRVTTDDIHRGRRTSSNNCPLALAMTRALGKGVSVPGQAWRYMDEHLDVYPDDYRPLSSRARAFILAFDRHKKVKPFTFILWRY